MIEENNYRIEYLQYIDLRLLKVPIWKNILCCYVILRAIQLHPLFYLDESMLFEENFEFC